MRLNVRAKISLMIPAMIIANPDGVMLGSLLLAVICELEIGMEKNGQWKHVVCLFSV